MAEILKTNALVTACRKARVPGRFLRERYFPTGDEDIFTTPWVYVERDADGDLAAPFTIPYSGSKLVDREAYQGEQLVPAFINPAIGMTIDSARKKAIGETLFDLNATPQQREQKYLAQDLVKLQNMVHRRIEWMCGQILTTGAVDCKTNEDPARSVRFQYFEGDSFGNDWAVTTKWTDADGDVYGTIANAANDIDEQYGELDLVLGQDLIVPFMSDEKIMKMLEVRNANVGQLAPDDRDETGAGYIGTINFGGRELQIWSYTSGAMVDGKRVNFIDKDCAIVIPRENFGAAKFGAISQYEEGDTRLHTYSAEFVPRVIIDRDKNQRKLEMASAPAPVPYFLDSWRVIRPL